jgi:hypothetical protein
MLTRNYDLFKQLCVGSISNLSPVSDVLKMSGCISHSAGSGFPSQKGLNSKSKYAQPLSQRKAQDVRHVAGTKVCLSRSPVNSRSEFSSAVSRKLRKVADDSWFHLHLSTRRVLRLFGRILTMFYVFPAPPDTSCRFSA